MCLNRLNPSSTVILAVVFLFFCIVVTLEIYAKESEDSEAIFAQYVEQFNKSYRFEKDEYNRRFSRFKNSLAWINSMNTLRTDEDSARYGFTEYSDMSHDEFISAMLNDKQSHVLNRRRNSIITETAGVPSQMSNLAYNIIRYQRDVDDLPSRVDWRERGVVSEIRNQGSCGACWAHSVIGTIESMISIQANSSSAHQLSVQQMIDCATNNNHGCRGGDTCNLLDWLTREEISIRTTDEYPFSNVEETHCKMSKNNMLPNTVKVKSFTCDNFVGQEHKILQILANYGTVAVAVNGLLWQNYLGGIIQFHCSGATGSLNHAVQIVGYDKAGDVPYYIVRNSWGPKFGDKGYLKILIGNNVCGIANQVSTVSVDVGPETTPPSKL